MKRAGWWLALASLILMGAAGCAGPAPATPSATQSAPTASAAPAAGVVSASAVVEPAKSSRMGFVVAAPVKEVNVKAGDQVKAGQALIVLDTPELSYAVAAAQAELQSAQANAEIQRQARKKRSGRDFVYASAPPEWKQLADARVEQAQAALEAAQANLAQGTLIAPFDGTVVSVDVTPGEMVAPNTTVLVLGNLNQLQIATTDLSEREIARVQVGQKATAQMKAFSQALTGQVSAIAPLAESSNGDTVFKVTIQLDTQPKGLLWGMTGDVTIVVK